MLSKEVIRYSLKNLWKNKSRNFLTVLSIFIGITTIFIFVSYGQGLYDYIEEVTESASADNIIVQMKGMSPVGGDIILTEDDLEAVEKTTGVYEAAGATFKAAKIQQNGNVKYAYLAAYNPTKTIVEETFSTEIIKGKRLEKRDKGKVVLGYNYLKEDTIFKEPYEINDEITIQGDDARVVGFFDEIGNPQDDSNIYVSVEYFEELYPNDSKGYNWIVGKIDISNKERVIENIEDSLRDSRDLEEGEEDFFVQTFEDMVDSYSSTLDLVIAFVIFIALISVIVSAVNTSNTMITSVLERTKEIGILKSIGAKNSEIFSVFLFESGFIGLLAGLIGIGLGYVLSYFGGMILSNLGYGFLQPAFPLWLFIGCLLFALLTGAISGVIPARNASKVNPVDALRYE
ncbi:MAG TPA: FtsX-like permease family protein [Candidatus Nanoarchaeia archaeon]|nr:FtsX-like permease family protein [Candidatus Nanoarchaeia archaeon]